MINPPPAAAHTAEMIVEGEIGLSEFMSALKARVPLQAIGPSACKRICLDSFDWGLFQSKRELILDLENGVYSAILKDRETEKTLQLALPNQPRFAIDFPPGQWREALEPAIGIRSLLPKITMQGMRQDYVSDAAETSSLRVRVDRYEILDSKAITPPLMRIEIAAAKGQGKIFRRVCRLADEFLTLERIRDFLLDRALDIAGLSTIDPSRLQLPHFEPGDRADTTAKLLLRGLLATMLVNEEGSLARWDTEFLHDYRVALRRSRALLRQFKTAFPTATVERFSRLLADLGRITGQARDWDVFLLSLDSLRSCLPAQMAGDLEPLHVDAAARAEAAHAQLQEYFDSAAYRHLIDAWRRFLDAPPAKRPRAENATCPVRTLAGRRIRKLHRSILNQAGELARSTPSAEIHELRKTAKKLRYLLELFRNLYPAEHLTPLIKNLREFQEDLGRFQDIQVKINHLESASGYLREQGASTQCLLAIGALLAGLYTDDRDVRRALVKRGRRFNSEQPHRGFRELLAEPKRTEKPRMPAEKAGEILHVEK